MKTRIVCRIKQALTQYQLPGLAVVINRGGEEVFAGGAGHFDAIGQRAINADTQFGVASLTKLVTTLIVMLLHEQRKLSVDDLLVDHYPTLKIARKAPIRLRHLLSHSAGFPGLPGRFHALNLEDISDRSGGVETPGNLAAVNKARSDTDWVPIRDAAGLVQLLNHLNFDLLCQPGERLNYSNEAYCLLGGVVEQVAGRPFAELARDWIFLPLGMARSAVGSAGLQASDNVALPLLPDGHGFRVGKFWQAPLFYPTASYFQESC